ncbi:MAG: tetratricopeptide repeat protein, partial [Rhodoferax sp.]|nr:tetratricopeptide repeat protein [Rhodoferax sp.]
MPRPSDSASSAHPPLADPSQTAIATVFRQGFALHQRGEVEAARVIYEQVLARQPLHFDALHLLGVVAYQCQDLQRAADLMEQAIAIHPQHAPCHSNRGLTLQHLQRLDEAMLHYDQALALQPDYADAHHNRGIALKLLGRLEEALASMDAALALQPDFAECLGNRGTVLQELGRMEEALASYDRALLLAPHSAQAHHNRATQLEKMQRYPEALIHYAEAIAIQPNHHEAWTGQGNCHEKLDRHPQALDSYAQAIACKPDHALAHYNRGNVLVNLMRHAEAIASYEQAIAIQPDYASAWWNKAINLLVQGRFAEGWPLYEWRWQGDARSLLRSFTQPLWLGAQSLAGKTILLHAEQGLGDSIQFCRYASQLSAQGATVLLEVPQPLVNLLAGLDGVSAVIEQGAELPAFDCHCPLLSLPLACKTQVHTIPAAPRYLASDPGQRQAWSARLGQKTRPRIGLVWSGNAAHSNDRKRSIALAELRPYLPAGFDYISLQNAVRDSDLPALQNSGIRHYAQHIHDFADTAALVDLLDLVISVDTSVAHLCGALGKTTLLLLPYTADWRWLLERGDSPWYPSLRLLRQGADRQWAPVLQTLAPLLQQAIANPNQPPARAAPRMGQAVQPEDAETHFNRGNLLRQRNNPQQALASYEQALARQPGFAQAWYCRGLALDDLARHAEALASYDQALALQPGYAEALHRRGTALQLLGRPQEALASLDAALALKADFVECLDHRGTVLYGLKRMEEALASYDRALAYAPAAALIHYNRGTVLEYQKRHQQALACYQRVIALQPHHFKAWIGVATAQQELLRFEDALQSHQQAIALQPDHAPAHFNLGNLLQNLLRHSEAIASYDRALALQPDFASAWWNKSIALLQTGQWDAGWALHEWRWKRAPANMRRHFQQPLWLGQPDLAGKTILLYAEQGLGDCIQFCRYAKQLKASGARVLLQVPEALLALVQGVEGVDVVLENRQPLPAFDFQCPLLSLPLVFQTRPDSIPAAAGYLHSHPQKRQQWRQRLGQRTKPRIGLVWSGNAEHKLDRFRSIPLADLCQHLPPGLVYVSLQKEVRSSDRAALAASGIRDVSQHLHDFADTAALVDVLDLVVCVDTSVAHLAGALGKTTWLLLPYVPDWRWLLEREDTPWYTSVTLLRQGAERQWAAVLQKLAVCLQGLAGQTGQTRQTGGT